MMDSGFRIDEQIRQINDELYSRIKLNKSETDRVAEAMLYSLKNGGKRVRPLLVLAFCRATGGDPEKAIPFAAAVEMIHTYSLIHDDLPCMDDDDFRRGQPSCHKRFDYATALLAGDGLLTLAFRECAEAELPDEAINRAVRILADAAGYLGMIGGQTMDLQHEGKSITADELRKTDELKTGCLIKAACRLGCVASGADARKIKLADEYADCVGLAFQIVDDLLDESGTQEELGKPIGSDRERCKSTYPALLGTQRSTELVAELTRRAVSAAEGLDAPDSFLADFARELAERKK